MAQWNFTPSLGASVALLVLFLLTTVTHVGQAIYHKKAYCWVITMSGVWQVLTYLFRTISIQNPDSFAFYAAWFVLILVAPLWTNAFVYVLFGRMVWNYTDDGQIWRLKASHFSFIFIVLDIIAFVVQVYGAAKATAKDATQAQMLDSLHVYMGGVGIQLLFILIFCFFAVRLGAQVRRRLSVQTNGRQDLQACMQLLCVQAAVLILIIIRIIFRIAEYSQGLDSTIPQHEVYQYTLDSLPMLIALVAFNLVHPGRVIQGERDMPPLWTQRKGKNTDKRGDELRLESVSRDPDRAK